MFEWGAWEQLGSFVEEGDKLRSQCNLDPVRGNGFLAWGGSSNAGGKNIELYGSFPNRTPAVERSQSVIMPRNVSYS